MLRRQRRAYRHQERLDGFLLTGLVSYALLLGSAPGRSMSIPASLISWYPASHSITSRSGPRQVRSSLRWNSASLHDVDAVLLLVGRVVDLQSRDQLSVIEAQQSPPGTV